MNPIQPQDNLLEIDLVQEVKETLECPICTRMPRIATQLLSCTEGHVICYECRKHPVVTTCPICRVSLSQSIRQPLLEKVVEVLLKDETDSCRYGCHFNSKLEQLSWHEKICDNRRAGCLMFHISGCVYRDSLKNAWLHYRQSYLVVKPDIMASLRIPERRRISIFSGKLIGSRRHTQHEMFWRPMLLDDVDFNKLGPIGLQVWRSTDGKFHMAVSMFADKDILREITVGITIKKYDRETSEGKQWEGKPFSSELSFDCLDNTQVFTINHSDLMEICNFPAGIWFVFAVKLKMSEFLTTTMSEWIIQE